MVFLGLFGSGLARALRRTETGGLQIGFQVGIISLMANSYHYIARPIVITALDEIIHLCCMNDA